MSRAHDVQHVGSAIDLEQRVIAPLVRVTDLDRERGQLLERLLLGRLVHPVERLDPSASAALRLLTISSARALASGGK